jgi:AGCS family alanine or glycine:cation symporter
VQSFRSRGEAWQIRAGAKCVSSSLAQAGGPWTISWRLWRKLRLQSGRAAAQSCLLRLAPHGIALNGRICCMNVLPTPRLEDLDVLLEQAMAPILNAISGTVLYAVPVGETQLRLIVVWLILGALFCTIFFRFIQFRGFVHGFKLIRGDYKDSSASGEVSHFQALSTALSGTVGLGNIAGVAAAVAIGGPGATFWMILAGLLGMASKFCECTLGVMYREVRPDGSTSGGPMYYLSRGLPLRYPGLAGFAKVLGAIFAVCCILGAIGGGNMFQSNQTYQQWVNVTGGTESWLADKGWLFGLLMATLVGLVIIGGIRTIARVTSKLVPAMAVVYCGAALTIIGMHITDVPAMFGLIIDGAFNADGIKGGVLGVLIMGFQRAAFSNEAGIGSAAIAHSAVQTREPVTEGLVALWEPFIDTVVICTMTSLVIIITGAHLGGDGLTGVQLTSKAFAEEISWFPYVLAVAVFLFAYSTMISWSYYGLKAVNYLFGHSRTVVGVYNILFLSFTVLGCSMTLGSVMDFSDAMIFVMSIPNLIGLYLLAPVVKRELDSYFARVRSGEIRSTRTSRK